MKLFKVCYNSTVIHQYTFSKFLVKSNCGKVIILELWCLMSLWWLSQITNNWKWFYKPTLFKWLSDNDYLFWYLKLYLLWNTNLTVGRILQASRLMVFIIVMGDLITLKLTLKILYEIIYNNKCTAASVFTENSSFWYYFSKNTMYNKNK